MFRRDLLRYREVFFVRVRASLSDLWGGKKAAELKESYTHSQYMKDFAKQYTEQERAFREKVFHTNLKRILKHNSGGHSWKAGVNKFTDWTQQEFQRL